MKKKTKPNKIAYYRKKAGFSNQKELGEKIGYSQQTISAFENNVYSPRVDDINALLDILKNITYDELFNTGRTSVYIAESNMELLRNYLKELVDIFPDTYSDYEKEVVVINHILKIFLEDDEKVKILKKVLIDENKKNLQEIDCN